MKDPEVEGKDVDVRFDPFDLSIAYAYIKGKWQKCVSEYATVFRDRTEKEIEQASQIIRRRAQAAGQQVSVSAGRLAEFLVSADAEESLRKQRLQDLALKKTLTCQTSAATETDNLVIIPAPEPGTFRAQATPRESISPAATELYPDC
jgi:hypothetical protein